MTFLAFGLVEAGGLFRMDFKDFGSYKYVTSDTGVTMNGSTLLWVWLKMGIAQLFWSLCERVSRINWHRFEIINMSLGVCFLCFVAQVGLAVPGRVLFPLSWRVSSMCCLVPVINSVGFSSCLFSSLSPRSSLWRPCNQFSVFGYCLKESLVIICNISL